VPFLFQKQAFLGFFFARLSLILVKKNMDIVDLRIPLEKETGDKLFETVEGEIIENLLRKARIEKVENEWKYILEGHSFKTSKKLAPSLFDTFYEVKSKLGFNDDIDFYITNSSELNAFSLASLEEGQSHIININSGLIERLDDDELRFVIGHEIGHLISRNAQIMKIIQFVFPDPSRVPLILQHKIAFWRKLSELTADRYGYVACPIMEKCVSSFFKLSSGLSTDRIAFDYKSYLEENDKILDYFRSESFDNMQSHPVNPIRIKAIEYFSESKLYDDYLKGSDYKEDEKLEEELTGLYEILMKISSSPLEMQRKYFIASAGIIAAGIDDNMQQDEYEQIVRVLSRWTIFPKLFLSDVFKSKKVNEIFNHSVQYILQNNPSERYSLFEYLIMMTMADKDISEKEIEFLYSIGNQAFGFSENECAQQIAALVQREFMPDLYT